MKRFILLLVAVLALVGLTACGETTPKDEVAPEISGVKNLTVVAGEEINLLAGITATDDVDGNITSKIEVTTLPQLTVTEGKVTPTLQGDYEVQYKVKDAAGNEGEAYAILTVQPALAEKVVYKEYTFESSSVEGWSHEFNSGAEGTAGVVQGRYQINVTKGTGVDWNVKYHNGGFATVDGVDYQVIFTFVSSTAGKAVCDGGEWVEFEANQVSKAKVSFVGNGENKYVAFQLGEAGPQEGFVVDIISIEIIERVGEDVYTDVTPEFDYDTEGVASGVFYDGSEGNFTSTATSATLNITKGAEGNGCWQTRIYLKPGFDLEAGKKYKISVDVYSQNGHKFEICYNNGDNEKGIGALYGLELGADETKTFAFTVSHDTAKDNLVLLFQLGELMTKEGSDVVTVSNLKIEEVGGNKVETSKSLNWNPIGFGCYNHQGEADGKLYIENDKLVYEMTQIGVTDWHNKMYVEKLTLEADKIYTISFTAKADKEISCAFFLNVFGKWDPRLSEQVTFTTTEKVYELTVSSAFAATMDFELLWQFGSTENQALGGAKIELSNLTIYSQDVQ